VHRTDSRRGGPIGVVQALSGHDVMVPTPRHPPCPAVPLCCHPHRSTPPRATPQQLRDIICHRIAVGHDADDVILPDEDVLLLPNAQVGVHEPKLAVQHLRGCGVVEVRGKGMEGTRW
jgi:hypothetical protein